MVLQLDIQLVTDMQKKEIGKELESGLENSMLVVFISDLEAAGHNPARPVILKRLFVSHPPPHQYKVLEM